MVNTEYNLIIGYDNGLISKPQPGIDDSIRIDIMEAFRQRGFFYFRFRGGEIRHVDLSKVSFLEFDIVKPKRDKK